MLLLIGYTIHLNYLSIHGDLLYLIHGRVSDLEDHSLLKGIELTVLTLIRESLPTTISRGYILKEKVVLNLVDLTVEITHM